MAVFVLNDFMVTLVTNAVYRVKRGYPSRPTCGCYVNADETELFRSAGILVCFYLF
jgi:hypothetical protein